MTMIPVEEREGLRCQFCNAEKSVKYLVTIIDSEESGTPQEVPCCNKCAALHEGQWFW